MDRDQFYRGLHLERHDSARNLHRAYGLQLARSLFGHWGVQRVWGRVGRPGRSRTEWFQTAGEAERVLRRDPSDRESPKLPCMTTDLRRTKTTDVEEGRSVKLVGRPAQALAAWLESEGISTGPVFRHVDRWENVSDRAMSPAGINHMIKRRLALAGYDEADHSAHGLWAGHPTQAAKDEVAPAGGKKAVAAPLGPAGVELLQRCQC